MLELNEGKLLAGRYMLVRRIGSGGMGEIWLADDRRAESRVALKFAADPAAAPMVELLKKEWRIGGRLMHANIIRVFEFHDDPGLVFYGMQYVAGPDISVLTGAPLEDILRPIGLIADALRYAHAKHLIHRDIKASNILLDSRGIPYLIDFGIAADAGRDATSVGSPIAASPQQLAGAAAAPADDVYSLGVLITELVTGHPPESGRNKDSDRGEAVSMTDQHSDPLPGALQALVTDMLDADAAARPDAEAVQERLRAAGFPPGAAPAHLLGVTGSKIEAVKVESIRPLERNSQSVSHEIPAAAPQSGVSPKMLYGGLAVMLLLFLGVIFLLPPSPEENPGQHSPTESNVSDGTDQGDTGAEPGISDADSATPGTDGLVVAPPESADEGTGFGEIVEDFSGDSAALTKAATDEALGDLLSRLERLQFRAIDRWGGQPYLDVLDIYREGDEAYVAKSYALAGEKYRKAIELLDPFFDRIDVEFEKAMTAGQEAFDNGDHVNAVRSFDLAVAITPGNSAAASGLARAKNLKTVLDLMDQALQFENDLELDAARIAFERVLDLDAAWDPAIVGLERIRAAIRQYSFDQRMTEGFDALASGDFATARAAFKAANTLVPGSRQPADGLLQVDQEVRLASIIEFERQATMLEQNEEWETAIGVYENVLEIDGDLQFAQDGLTRTRQRLGLHHTLNNYIDDPDALSAPATMQAATRLLLDLSRISPTGPRLEQQKESLARLLKRAATPLAVMLISDSQTEVSVLRVARLGLFQSRELSLRPGVYVAVGSRAGYRDVRLEFRVAPEIEMKPIVVQCEEQI